MVIYSLFRHIRLTRDPVNARIVKSVLDSDGTGSMRNNNNIVNLNGFTEIQF
jgi:hypothetical protein